MPPDPNASPDWPGKLEARGKFFFSGADKVFLKGVTYGPFAPDALGSQFPAWEAIARDLELITELGANTLRTFTVPPRFVLDLAARLRAGPLLHKQALAALEVDAAAAERPRHLERKGHGAVEILM